MTKHIAIERRPNGVVLVSFPKSKALIEQFRSLFEDAKFLDTLGAWSVKLTGEAGKLLDAWANEADAKIAKGLEAAKANPVKGSTGYITLEGPNYVIRGYHRELPPYMRICGGVFRNEEHDKRWEISVLDGELLAQHVGVLDRFMPEVWEKERAKRSKSA